MRKPLNSGDIFQTRHTSNIYQSEKVQSTSALKIFIMHCVRCNCHGHNSYPYPHFLKNQPSNSFNQVKWTGVCQLVSVWKTNQWQQWDLGQINSTPFSAVRYPIWFNSIFEFCQQMIHSIFDSILHYPRFNSKYYSVRKNSADSIQKII